jgi:hypothetical protein
LGRASDALDDYVCMSLIDGPSQDEGVDAAIQRLLQQMGKAEAEGVWKLRSQGTKLAGLPKPGFCRAFLYSFTRDQRLLHAGGAGQLELRDATDALQGLGPGSEAAGEQQYKVGRLLKSTLQLEQSAVHFEEAAKSASAKTRALALDVRIGSPGGGGVAGTDAREGVGDLVPVGGGRQIGARGAERVRHSFRVQLGADQAGRHRDRGRGHARGAGAH